MPTNPLSRAVGKVRCALAGAADLPATDGQLVARFVADRDEAAFVALVRRHGPMVLGVCRRVTGDYHAAEDALQATFLVLARRAADVAPPDRVGPWLYGVAWRVARAAQKAERRRSGRERPTGTLPEVAGPEPGDLWDVGPVLDEELRRLPAKYRHLLVGCYLAGRRPRDVARALGIPEGTVASRLATARTLLGARLTRRGVALSAAALLGSAREAAAAVPWVRLAPAVRAGRLAAGEIPTTVAALLNRKGIWVMESGQLRTVAFSLIAATGVVLGAGGGQEPPHPPRPAPAATPRPTNPPAVKLAATGRLLLWRRGQLSALTPAESREVAEVMVTNDRRRHVPDATSARWAPDRKRIAFTVTTPPELDGPRLDRRVFVRGTDEPEPGTDLGVCADYVIWSPDGFRLLAVEYTEGADGRPGGVTHRLVDVRTKESGEVKLPPGYTLAVTDWSRDGMHFLAAGFKDGTKEEKDAAGRLYLVPRAGGEPVSLTRDGQRVGGHAVLSADGRKVLYLADDPERKDVKDRDRAEAQGLFVLDVKAGTSVRLAEQPIDATIVSFCWSPDGKRLAYVWHREAAVPGDRQDGKTTEYTLVVADADGRNARAVASESGPGYGLIFMGSVDWR